MNLRVQSLVALSVICISGLVPATFSQAANSKKPMASTAKTDIAKLEKFADLVKGKASTAIPDYAVTINIDPKLETSQWSKDSVASVGPALKVLKGMGTSPSKPINIYISWGAEYRDQYIPDYCKWPSGGGSCGQTGIMFADLKWFADSWGYSGVEAPYKWDMDKFTIQANLPHELGHHAMSEAAVTLGNTQYWQYLPPWLREGGAEYFKLLTYAFDKKVSYKSLHDQYLRNGGNRCGSMPLSEMNAQDSKTDGCEYAKGLFAVEYLVLKTGSVDALFKMNRVTGSDTASIFKIAYGFSLADFNKEADAYYSKLITNTK